MPGFSRYLARINEKVFSFLFPKPCNFFSKFAPRPAVVVLGKHSSIEEYLLISMTGFYLISEQTYTKSVRNMDISLIPLLKVSNFNLAMIFNDLRFKYMCFE